MAEGDRGEKSDDSPAKAGPVDGSIDFSRYLTAQLDDLVSVIDRDRTPLNYENLLAEIQKRKVFASGASATTFPVRWTARDGILGWLGAVARGAPFYGAGLVKVRPDTLTIEGKRRNWFGKPYDHDLSFASSTIRNVDQDGLRVGFDVARPWRRTRHYGIPASSLASASQLAALLPSARDFASDGIIAYRRVLQNRTAWVTAILLFVNILLFALMAVSYGTVTEFDVTQLVPWGASSATLTMNDGWWRLIAAGFLHNGWVHLTLNMWVLWAFGRLTEKLYGSLPYATIYLVTLILAGLCALVWSPFSVGVGASGAIFGVLGAFVASLFQQRTRLPIDAYRSRLIPTVLFVGFNLIGGFEADGVANAAHLGGLVSGIVIGLFWAQPVGSQTPVRRRIVNFLAGSAAAAAMALGALLYLDAFSYAPTIPERYFAEHDSLADDWTKGLADLQAFSAQAVSGLMNEEDMTRKLETEILPLWRNMADRLKAEEGQPAAAGTRRRSRSWSSTPPISARNGRRKRSTV